MGTSLTKSQRDPFSEDGKGRANFDPDLVLGYVGAGAGCTVSRQANYRELKDAHFAFVETNSIWMRRSRIREAIIRCCYTLLLGVDCVDTFQIEELASHGYIVIGVDHPYSSRITAFPDGRIAHRKFIGEEDYYRRKPSNSLKRLIRQVRIRAKDVSFVIDQLEELGSGSGRRVHGPPRSWSEVGIFEFSLGGGTAAQACWLDRRISAGVDIGGMVARPNPQARARWLRFSSCSRASLGKRPTLRGASSPRSIRARGARSSHLEAVRADEALLIRKRRLLGDYLRNKPYELFRLSFFFSDTFWRHRARARSRKNRKSIYACFLRPATQRDPGTLTLRLVPRDARSSF